MNVCGSAYETGCIVDGMCATIYIFSFSLLYNITFSPNLVCVTISIIIIRASVILYEHLCTAKNSHIAILEWTLCIYNYNGISVFYTQVISV